MRPLLCAFAVTLLASAAPGQDLSSFQHGPLLPDFGRIATVDADMKIPANTTFRVAFDLARGERNTLNRNLDSVARFLNMHAAAGVPADRLHAAVIIHGSAVFDIVSDNRYGQQFDGDANPNRELVEALIDQGVQVILCGQSAAARGISKGDLLPGVKLALSAMTAHALLQQDGYTLNPF